MAADEKDRYGDKLRDVERAREDLYFAERDRKLVEELRRSQAGASEATLKDAAKGRCPSCGTELQRHSGAGVSAAECPSCHGVWLDQGDLTELARQEADSWIARWLRNEFRKSE
jgi:DNA repair exonuclease SbcCD ATPase subunit